MAILQDRHLSEAERRGCDKMPMSDFIVYLVDDDSGVLKALARMLRLNGLSIQAYSSPLEFLVQHDPCFPGCAILDFCMPGFDGLKLQQELAARHHELPIIFLTGRGDIPTGVQAMKAGAIDFLTKPVKNRDLLAAIERARERVARMVEARSQLKAINIRLATLTPREREVLELVVAGRINKQIAYDLGTVEKTIKVHRGRMMKKMGVRVVADLVRMAEKVGIRPSQ